MFDRSKIFIAVGLKLLYSFIFNIERSNYIKVLDRQILILRRLRPIFKKIKINKLWNYILKLLLILMDI